MKPTSILAVVAAVVSSSVAFAQQAKPATAPADAPPPVEVKTDAGGAKNNWILDASYDYYKYEAQWGGTDAVKAYFGPTDVFSAGKRHSKLTGGTASLGKYYSGDKLFTFDLSYRKGDGDVELPNKYVSTSGSTTNFVDHVRFDDEIYDFRLSWRPSPHFYLSGGYYTQSTDQKYEYFNATSTGAKTGTATPVPNLSGTLDNSYYTVGVGTAIGGAVGGNKSPWTFGVKLEGLFLYGDAKKMATRSFSAYATTNTPLITSKETVTGAKGRGSVRLSYAFNESVSFGVEGGAEYSKFFSASGAAFGDESLTYIGRAVLQFTF